MSHLRLSDGVQCDYPDGHSGRCRPLGYREWAREWNREYQRKRRRSDPAYREQERERQRTPEYRERQRKQKRERRATDPEWREREREYGYVWRNTTVKGATSNDRKKLTPEEGAALIAEIEALLGEAA